MSSSSSSPSTGQNIQAAGEAAANTIKSAFKAARDFDIQHARDLGNSPVAIHWFGISFVIVILLWVITYITAKLNLEKVNCGIISKANPKPSQLTSLSSKLTSPDYMGKNIRDFYIKTAYNCCASGNFKSDYVTMCALYNVIAQGCRCLDFEIYCLNDTPVVAVSSIDQIGVKQSYNFLYAADVLSAVNTYALNSNGSTLPSFVPGSKDEKQRFCPNPTDPLFLHFRLKTNNVNTINQLAAIIAETFQTKLLPIEFMRESNGKNMTRTPINDLVDTINGKVIIMVEKNSNTGSMPILYRSPNMWELTNITTNSVFIHEKRFTDIKNTNSPKEIIEFNRQNMTIVLPDLNENNTNYIYVVPRMLGCQFIAMNFQNNDQNLISYNNFFDNMKCAFVPRPDELLYVPVFIPEPKKIDKDLLYSTKKTIQVGGIKLNF
jgi:hypothetical protein